MKTIVITGKDYMGSWTKTRTACRGIVRKDNQILLTCDTKTDLWMIPGGGKEKDEADSECCIREVAEETGILVHPQECFLEIIEYYDDWKWVNRYFYTEITGTTERHLTKQEQSVGTEPRWLPLSDALDLFSRYEDYYDIYRMQRNLYLREYTALLEIVEK